MENNSEIFEIIYKGGLAKVETIHLQGEALYRVNFADTTPSLVICRSTDFNQAKFYTSIPEGRQDTAEAIGPLIEKYFQSKMK
jgi:hypothetical protein